MACVEIFEMSLDAADCSLLVLGNIKTLVGKYTLEASTRRVQEIKT